MSNWIKVSDRLPIPDTKINTHAFKKVLVWGGMSHGDSIMFYEHKGFHTNLFSEVYENDPDKAAAMLQQYKEGITHWMPIEPPEQD